MPERPALQAGQSSDHALIIGKFYPPHAGHHHLIDTALAECSTVNVICMAADVESIPLDKRVEWLKARHPRAHVFGVVDNHPVEYSPETWLLHMDIIHGVMADYGLHADYVYSSEAYGWELAERLSNPQGPWAVTKGLITSGPDPIVYHRMVDFDRTSHPTSGTAVRADPVGNFQHLTDPVRTWFTMQKRVVVIGAESTGTTTLTRDLARFYNTVWVPEFGRTFSEGVGLNWNWGGKDFQEIARMQVEMERMYAERSPNGMLLCDTDMLATCVWQHFLTGSGNGLMEAIALSYAPALYIVTPPEDIPWEDDGTREGEHFRQSMHEVFDAINCAPVLKVRGSRDDRLKQAVGAIDDLMILGWELNDPLG